MYETITEVSNRSEGGGYPACQVMDIMQVQVVNISGEAANHSHTGGSGTPISWMRIVIPAICILGVVGNVLNILVLTRRRLLSGMDRLEKSANWGLISLAFSDMMFCVMVFPSAFINGQNFVEQPFSLYYKVYGIGLINLFLMISTWLIVSMAVNRFIVVVYPFKARQTLSTTRTLLSILAVCVLSTLLTSPYFFNLVVAPCIYEDGRIVYEFKRRWSGRVSLSVRTYIRWIWPIFADFVPVLVLAFCNTRLVWELRQAKVKRIKTCQGQAVKDSGHKVTLTLVIIVLMLLLLVSPSEILRYVNPYKSWGHIGHIVADVTNVMQALNFATNFCLYCAVNPTFRNTIKSMILYCCPLSDGAQTTPSKAPMLSEYTNSSTAMTLHTRNGCKSKVISDEEEIDMV